LFQLGSFQPPRGKSEVRQITWLPNALIIPALPSSCTYNKEHFFPLSQAPASESTTASQSASINRFSPSSRQSCRSPAARILRPCPQACTSARTRSVRESSFPIGRLPAIPESRRSNARGGPPVRVRCEPQCLRARQDQSPCDEFLPILPYRRKFHHARPTCKSFCSLARIHTAPKSGIEGTHDQS